MHYCRNRATPGAAQEAAQSEPNSAGAQLADHTTTAAARSLRERKKLETRSALRAAAVRMYLERGPSAVTVHDICEAAGVSPRTFFNYFETKDDAVFDWDRRLAGQLVELLARRPTDEPPLEALHQTLRTAVPALVADPGWLDRRRLLGAYPELVPKLLHSNSHIAEALADAVAERTGLPPDALYPRILGGTGLTVLRASIRAWDPESPAEELLATLDSCFDSLAAGLPQPEGDDPVRSAR
ncbi:TetR family transcriptional regulator [Streptomyces sp. 891-h]|uniref:TetR/AcrR family transcriptional regulator n=1 Tax=unclassified Streptomyces TaxID=2593676 RepID=UPI001FAA9C02|nr:TetR family transcriptional regulator [Streptomyces sp. 891-h]UNZ16491.1 TetR family transcriptional regulator [Streptomyces sp. 891-h]